jgi:hypothetical protein
MNGKQRLLNDVFGIICRPIKAIKAPLDIQTQQLTEFEQKSTICGRAPIKSLQEKISEIALGFVSSRIHAAQFRRPT